MGTNGSRGSRNDLNANFKCEATGDFRKAICEYTWVVQSDEACNVAYNPSYELKVPDELIASLPPPLNETTPNPVPDPGRNIPPIFGLNPSPFPANNHNAGIVKCKFMLDQLDADTGKVDELMCDTQCCGSDGCSDFPWFFAGLRWSTNPKIATDPSLLPIPPQDLSDIFGPQLLVNLSMEAGKSNNHVKAIKVKQFPMVTETGRNYIPDGNPFNNFHYLRKIAGGFKEL